MEFVRALALTWKNLSAYPPTHPAVKSSLELVDHQLRELRGPAGEVILGIGNDGLLYGSTKIDSTAAQKFAHALYTRGVAVLRFGSETTTEEIATFLRLLTAGTPGSERRVLWEDLTAAGVMNINLQPVSYTAIHVTDHIEPESERKQSLWEDILRALLENQQFSAQIQDLPSRVETPDEFARLLAECVEATATSPTFDPNATFGVRIPSRAEREPIYRFLTTTIGESIAQATGRKKQHSLEQAIQLLQTLAGPLRATVLRGVLQGLSADRDSATLLREFAAELPSDEVLDALRYLSSTGNLSATATTLLQSLTALESRGTATAPSANVLVDLVALFGEEDLDRFNSADHRALLQTAVVQIPDVPREPISSLEHLGDRRGTVANAALLRQFSEIVFDLVLEMGRSRDATPVLGRLESLFTSYLESREYDDALALVSRMQEISRSHPSDGFHRSLSDSLSRFADGNTIQTLIDCLHTAPPEKAHIVQRLAEILGEPARRSLLIALAEEQNRSRRRRLFDFIVAQGPVIVPEAKKFLSDERWYVLRNIITLLRAVGDRTSLPELQTLARHRDLRVRMEAIKSLFVIGDAVPPTLLDDLFADRDAKIAEAAVNLVGTYAIKEGVDPLLRILSGNDVFGAKRQIRVKAIRALADIGEPAALGQLDRFFKSSMLPWPSKEERYAAWETLQKYPAEVRKPFVETGLRSGDPQIRAICARLTRS